MKKIALAVCAVLVSGFSALAAQDDVIKVLVVGKGVSAGVLAQVGRIVGELKGNLDITCAGKNDFRVALEGKNWDAVVFDPPSAVALDRQVLVKGVDGLSQEVRKLAPSAGLYLRQPWSFGKDDFAKYDEIAFNCMDCAIRNGLETIPSGFAVQAFREECPDAINIVAADGSLNARGEYLDAAVWAAKFIGKSVTGIAYAPPVLKDRDEIVFMRRCAQEAVNIMTPIPVEAEWWKNRMAVKQKEIAALQGEVDLVFVGSSQIHIWETRCPTQLKDIQRDFTLLNLGYSGDSFQKVCWLLIKGHELDGYKAKCIMLLQGGNNTSETPTARALGLKQILDIFRIKQPQAKVLLLPINPRTEWDCGTAPRQRPAIDKANKILKRYADGERILWVDFRAELYDDNDDTLWCMPGDRLHFGSEGLKIWYSHVIPLFHEICGKPVPPVTEGWIDRTPERRTYVPGEPVWSARLNKRGGFIFEKIGGAQGKVEFKDGRIMIHKTNAQGALVLKAHPFASHTNINVRIYADVEVESAEHGRSQGYLAADGFDPADFFEALDARPAGCKVRKYFHVASKNGDLCPTIVISGAPSKSRWTNWRAEDLVNPRKNALKERPLPEDEGELFAASELAIKPFSAWQPDVAVVTDEDHFANAKQLELLEGSAVAYSRFTMDEVLARPELIKSKRLIVFLAMRKVDEARQKLLKSLSLPGKNMAYVNECGVLGGLEELTGIKLLFSEMPKTLEVVSESVRWPDLTPCAYGETLQRRVQIVPDDKLNRFAHFADDKQAVAVGLKSDAAGCRHIYIAAQAGLTPEYFNRLSREAGAYVPTDETGLKVAMNGDVVALKAYRTGRFDFKLPFPCKVINRKTESEEPLKGEILPLNLVAGEICIFTLDDGKNPCAGKVAGWENIKVNRWEVPPADVVWTADVAAGGFDFECRDGAEGAFGIENGELVVRKMNDKGYLLLKAPSFASATNRMLRFWADVACDGATPEYSHAFLRAHGDKEYLAMTAASVDAENVLGMPEMVGLINTAPGMTVRKYACYASEDGTIRPVIVIAGHPSVSRWTNWAAEDHDSAKQLWRERYMALNGSARRRPPTLTPDAEFDEMLANDIDHTAKIEKFGNAARMLIDGKPTVPSIYLGMRHIEDYTEASEAKPLYDIAGLPVIAPIVHTGAGGPYSQAWTKDGFDAKKAVGLFRETMRASGGALAMITFNCNAYREFVERDHPSEVWLDEKGEQIVGNYGSSVVGYNGLMDLKNAWPWVSMSSRVWREAVKSNIRAFVAELKRTGLSKRVLGVHFQGYNDGQFGMNRPDYSPCAKAEYQEYLKEALANGRSTNYWHFCRQIPARTVEEFGRTFKESMGKDVIVYRRLDSPFVVDFALGANARSSVIDVSVTGPTYEYRAPGISCSTFVPFSSMSANGKMVWNEFDLRTWNIRQAGSVVGCRGNGESRDIVEWKTTFRKLTGEMLADRGGFWFYDMGRGWFTGAGIPEDIRDAFATVQKLQERTPSAWKRDVAIIVDEEGFFGFDGGERGYPGHTYQIVERQIRLLGNAGVPYDYYLAEDVMRRPELLDGKKMVVFMLWRKFDEQRIRFVNGLRKTPRTLVFLAECGSLGGAEAAMGFQIDFSWESKTFEVLPEPSMTEEVKGVMDIEMIRGGWFGRRPGRTIMVPSGRRGSVVEAAGVIPLGRFADDHSVAVAFKKDGAVLSVYIATPGGMSPGFFNHLAHKSGAYVPVEPYAMQVNMNGDFVSVHALKNGVFDFKLPYACTVINEKTGRAENTTDGKLKLKLTAGQTCWFTLDAE